MLSFGSERRPAKGDKMKLVWINDEECWGIVTVLSSHHCIVKYSKDGMIFEELFLLDEVVDARELGIDYENEEDNLF